MLRRLLAWLLVACASSAALAQPEPPRPQRGGTFIEPPARVDPRYLPAAPGVYPGKGGDDAVLALRLVAELPLRRRAIAGLGTQGSQPASPTLQAHLRWTPWRGQPWFAQLGFFRYLDSDRQQPWHPDFTYAFGYEDFRPGTWSLSYANYTGTRLRPDRARGETRWNFDQGQWTLSRRFALTEAAERLLLAGDGDQATCTAGAHLMRRYVDGASGALRRNKTSLSLGCRYTRPEGWYAHFTLHAWPQGGQQQPWDPDFTYGVGHDRLLPAGWSVRYDNWSGNRLPGRSRAPGEGTLRSGSILVEWRQQW